MSPSRALIGSPVLSLMSPEFKRANAVKKRAKLRLGFRCFGCNARFSRARHLHAHQGRYWPGCPVSFPADQALLAELGIFIQRPVDNSVDKGI